MLDYEFRVWDKEKKEMFYTAREFGIELQTKDEIIGYSKDVQEYFDIMQYIRKKDINDKKIFAGDIVNCQMNGDNYNLMHRGIIVWFEKYASFATLNHGGKTLFHHLRLDTMEIIGNQYENPGIMGEIK